MSPKPAKRVKRERFLPYAHERFGVEMQITGVVLDARRDVEAFDPDRRRIDVDEVDWRELTVHGSLRVPPLVIERVFPPAERLAPPARLLVVLRSGATRLREGVEVGAVIPERPATFELRIRRDDVLGTVELVPYLLRAGDGRPVPGFANLDGSRLASARLWTLRVDRARDPAGEFLDTRYHPFSTDEQLRPYASAVYRLELSEQPTLWINTDHAKVAAVLEEEGTRGSRARIRELVFDYISQGVWTQLFVQAAVDLRDGDLVFPWEDTVLRELLPGVVEGRTHAERMRALAAALERGELPLVLSRLDPRLQQRDRLVEHLEKLIEDTGTKT
ncbi:MAG: hypothetical protein KC619_09370 [Myxococcales bacterium]|nr:hypothetical protein [Myxococcales bacterium]